MSTTSFRDLVSYDIGGGWGTAEAEPGSSSIGFVIRGTDIPRVATGDVSTVPLRFHKASNLGSRVLAPGDIVFEVSGGSSGQPVGRALQITDKILGKFDEPVMCASFCKLVRIDPTRAIPGYIFRLLQAAYADGGLDTYQVQSTGITNFKWKPFLDHFEVDLPTRYEQQQVASILDVFDDLIENNRRRVEVLEEMARTIYREWFVKFRYPGHADVPLVDSALGPIPSGWDIAPVSDVIAVNPRIKLDKSVEHPFIAMGDLDERTMSCRPSQVRTGGSGAKFVQGDTLFARITPCLENGKTGLVQRLAVGEVGLGSTEFIVLRGRAVGSAFTYCLARESDFRKHAIASMSGASGRQRVRNECFDTYLLPVPSRDIADAFESSMDSVFSQVAVLTDEAEQLRHLRDLLLPKLVTGQIDVSTLDLDALVGDRVA
ncbi:restriction endonuclease subunit S [Gordonia rubripertincta]|uniref:restriction endonuclease subunit S n=1 Tax=Gordonia rubripertincta TaxID=36822 RepID=UPI001EF755E5|nr:restriction endonuclease subunit S [Gordonia rubripertincta]